jgi:autoinducer 2-degrading protein
VEKIISILRESVEPMEPNDESEAWSEHAENHIDVKALIGLLGVTVGTLALVWSGKKAINYLKDKNVKTASKISREDGSQFYVKVNVKPLYVSEFIAATRANTDATRKESGNIRYDLYQSQYDRTQFILHEIYRSQRDEEDHRKTAHYKKWNSDVEPMMATKREKYYEGGIPFGYVLNCTLD